MSASSSSTTTTTATASGRKDPSSLANVEEIVTRSMALAVTVDFKTETLRGEVVVECEGVSETPVSTLVLDTRGLEISGAWVQEADGSRVSCAYTLGSEQGVEGILGRALTVGLPQEVATGARVSVGIEYATSPSASALQWLNPEQTAGGEHPYLFSQCQAIHARSMVPCQDTPVAKFTYTATITVPTPLRALMSALRVGDQAASAESGVWAFEQPVPIPSYLFAIAVGDLVERNIGPRSSVFCEPAVIEAAAHEFGADTEGFVAGGEALLGDYVWGRYDILVQPPSAPFGGMENASLTFVTPTLLAGDRSLVNVVAHEIAHSWMGNLVTSAQWADFWLNEGHTVYIERRLLGNIHGEAFRQFEAIQGWATLKKTVHEVFSPEHPYTCLVPDLSSGIDPDDVFSSVPYEKGFALLYYLEGLVGGMGPMEAYLKSYVAKFANKSVTTDMWKACFLEYFEGKVDSEVLAGIDWQTWLYAPGMPPVTPTFDTSLVEACQDLADKWVAVNSGEETEFVGGKGDIDSWHAGQVVEMIEIILSKVKAEAGVEMKASTLEAMDAAYVFSTSSNYEILFAWVLLGIAAEYEPILDVAVRLLTSQGRMKFVRPTFRALNKSVMGADLAKRVFAENRKRYHPTCEKMVAKDLA